MGRVHSFESLGLVGEARHPRLDSLVRLAAQVIGAPVAMVSVIQPDLERQFLSSWEGVPEDLALARQVPISLSICRHVQESGSPLVIPDLRQDARTATNRLVLEHGMRAYLGVPIHTMAGQSIGALCCMDRVVCDWTDRQIETMRNLAACVDDLIVLKTLQIEEQKVNHRLRAMAGARSGFVSHISHEIRTPLTGMVGAIRLLDRLALTGLAGDLVAVLNRNALRLLDISNETLSLARMDAGTFRIAHDACDLHQIALDVVDSHRAAARLKAVEVRVCDRLAGQPYLVDRMALASVLDHLFSNAVKFTTHGSAEIRLGHDSYGNVKIEVVDTGSGIPPALQGAIFAEFEQAGPRIARTYGGTGLGMAMVKRLVELMDGEIDLVSQPACGTTVTIILPLEAAQGAKAERMGLAPLGGG